MPGGRKYLDIIAKNIYNTLKNKGVEFNVYYWSGDIDTTENYVFFLKEGEETKINKNDLPFESQWVEVDEEPFFDWEKYKIDFEVHIDAKKFGI